MRSRWFLTLALTAIGVAAGGGVARAQAAQTWVSGVGDDANPCSRTAPCQTFAGAISKTAAGGEIDALDPGGFGAVTITTAITIDGGGNGFITTTSGDAITIAAGATDLVTLRNLTIHNPTAGGGNGITVTSAGAVALDGIDISGYTTGIAAAPAAGTELVASNLSLHDNATTGVSVSSTGGITAVAITRSHIAHSATGIAAVNGAHVTVFDSAITGNATVGVSAALDASGGDAQINLEDVDLSGNAVATIANGVAGTPTIRMSQVLVTGEQDPTPTVETGTGQILSFGNNRLDVQPVLTFANLSPTQTVTAGGSATFNTSVAISGIHAQPISFTCAGLPAGTTCTVAPMPIGAGIDTGGPVVTITTTAPTSGAGVGVGWVVPPSPPPWLLALIAGVLALAWLERRWRVLRAALLVVALATACGDNTHPGAPDATQPDATQPGMPGTPSGTYSFTVTASAGASQTTSAQFTLVVQ